MKINSITINTGNYKGRGVEHSSGMISQGEFKRHNNTKQYNSDQINTTIKSNSDGRVNFRGGVPLLHKAANFAHENPLVAEALFALVITCGIRPLSIMATAKNDEDKEKCTYQAVKSISSGLVGLGMTALVATPIALATKHAQKSGAFKMPEEMKEEAKHVVDNGVKLLKDFAEKIPEEAKNTEFVQQIRDLIHGNKLNLNVLQNKGKHGEKIFKEKIKEKAPEIFEPVKEALTQQRIINNYEKTGKNVIDKLFQPIFMPLRATITIALVPMIMSLFGQKKPQSKPQQEQGNPYETLKYNVLQNQNDAILFKSFSGVANHENK